MIGATDDDLRSFLGRAKGGDAGALAAVLGYASARFQKVAAKLKRRYPTAAAHEGTGDLFQDALIKLFQQYSGRPERVPEDAPRLRVHVVQALHDVCRDRTRKHRGPHGLARRHVGPVIVEPANSETSVSGRAMRREERESILAAIDDLPPKSREVVKLYYSAEDMTYRKVADILGLHWKTVRRRLEDAIEQMQSKLA